MALVAAARFRPEPVDGLILVEPAVRRGVRLAADVGRRVRHPGPAGPGYSRRLTRGVHAQLTPAARQRLGHDPRIVRSIRADAYKGLLSLADAASASTRRLRLPTLFLYGRADGIIPLRLFEQAVRDLSPLVTALRYPEAPHLLLQTRGFETCSTMSAAGSPAPPAGRPRCRAAPRRPVARGTGSAAGGRSRAGRRRVMSATGLATVTTSRSVHGRTDVGMRQDELPPADAAWRSRDLGPMPCRRVSMPRDRSARSLPPRLVPRSGSLPSQPSIGPSCQSAGSGDRTSIQPASSTSSRNAQSSTTARDGIPPPWQRARHQRCAKSSTRSPPSRA